MPHVGQELWGYQNSKFSIEKKSVFSDKKAIKCHGDLILSHLDFEYGLGLSAD
jgi:hypothetical protein